MKDPDWFKIHGNKREWLGKVGGLLEIDIMRHAVVENDNCMPHSMDP